MNSPQPIEARDDESVSCQKKFRTTHFFFAWRSASGGVAPEAGFGFFCGCGERIALCRTSSMILRRCCRFPLGSGRRNARSARWTAGRSSDGLLSPVGRRAVGRDKPCQQNQDEDDDRKVHLPDRRTSVARFDTRPRETEFSQTNQADLRLHGRGYETAFGRAHYGGS